MKEPSTVALLLMLSIGPAAIPSFGQSHARIKEPVISNERERARLALGQLGVEYSNESLVKRAQEGDTIAVKLLLEAGLDPNTPLTTAAAFGQVETLQLLLSRGADPNMSNGGKLPLSMAVAYSSQNSVEVAKLLFEAGADASAKDAEGKTPIFAAVYRLLQPTAKDREFFKLLLSKGADVNARDKTGYTPLMKAASISGGGPGAVAALLDAGADVNARAESGETPLILTALAGNLDVVRVLLARGADPNAVDKHGWTPLIMAVSGNHAEAVKELLAGGADVNLKTTTGTALTTATYHNHPAIAKLLQEAGAK